MSDDGRCSHPGFDASEKWCVECVTTLRARLTAAEGLLKRWCLDAKKCTYGPHAFGCITCDTRAFLAAPPGRREAPACTHRCSLVGCNEMGTLVQGTGWLCPKHAALIPAAPIPQPAPAPQVCGTCGLEPHPLNHRQLQPTHQFVPCPTCRPATPGDGRERP